MEQPESPKGLAVGTTRGPIAQGDLKNVTYYTGHETIIPTGRRLGMARWRETLFAFMHHNARGLAHISTYRALWRSASSLRSELMRNSAASERHSP
jgi:K+ transporter